MIEVAHKDYGYEEDHRLNDAISSLANITLSIGEIVGPILGSFASIYLSPEAAYMILGLFLFAFFIVYAFSLALFKSTTFSKPLLSSMQIELN